MSVGIPEIEPTELKARFDAGEAPVVVDVRESFERAIADLPDVGQLHIPLASLATRMHELDRETEIVVYCRSGGAAARSFSSCSPRDSSGSSTSAGESWPGRKTSTRR